MKSILDRIILTNVVKYYLTLKLRLLVWDHLPPVSRVTFHQSPTLPEMNTGGNTIINNVTKL